MRCKKWSLLKFIGMSAALISVHLITKSSNNCLPIQTPKTLSTPKLQELLKKGRSQIELSQSNINRSNVQEIASDSNHLKIAYRDLSGCTDPKPLYLKEYRGHCWRNCTDKNCKRNRGKNLRCFSNLHLIGYRSSGAAEFTNLMRNHSQLKVSSQHYNLNLRDMDTLCPIDYFSRFQHNNMSDSKAYYFNSASDNAVSFHTLTANATHLQVVTVPQLLGFMATPDTKFYMQLRNPTERVVSYLVEKFSRPRGLKADSLDKIVKKYTALVTNCMTELGELVCFYSTISSLSNAKSILLINFYIITIEETLKFIPRHQIMFKTTSEFNEDPVPVAMDVSENFFKLNFPTEVISKLNNKKINDIKFKSVYQSTLEYLDKFFEPYNRRLADLLGDDKWLFKVNRTLQNSG